MKKTIMSLAGAAILLSSSVVMADEVAISFDSLLVSGQAYDANGAPVGGNPAAQTLSPGYHAPDGIIDSHDVGRVSTMFNNTTSTTIFDRAGAAYELTFVISGADDVIFRPTATPNMAQLFSLGMHVDVYQDFAKDYSIADGSGAGNGTLVLSLDAHNQTDSITGGLYNLMENYNYSDNTYGGTALLDVVGGTWAADWNTNQRIQGTDLELTFSLNTSDPAHGRFTLTGTASAVGNTVPEPTTMLLFGTGLIGLAAVGRKKLRK
jgi:hypothetical protein